MSEENQSNLSLNLCGNFCINISSASLSPSLRSYHDTIGLSWAAESIIEIGEFARASRWSFWGRKNICETIKITWRVGGMKKFLLIESANFYAFFVGWRWHEMITVHMTWMVETKLPIFAGPVSSITRVFDSVLRNQLEQ